MEHGELSSTSTVAPAALQTVRMRGNVSGPAASVWTGPIDQFNRPGDLASQYLLELKQITLLSSKINTWHVLSSLINHLNLCFIYYNYSLVSPYHINTTAFRKKDLLTSKETRKVINHQKNSEGKGKLMNNLFFIIVAVTASSLQYFAENNGNKLEVFL